MQAILLPFFDDAASATAFRVAAKVARKFDGHIEGLFAQGMPVPMVGLGVSPPISYPVDLTAGWNDQAQRAHALFDRCVKEEGLGGVLAGRRREPTASWSEIEGPQNNLVGEYGRVFDLIVLPGAELSGTVPSACEAALFESGRPVLLASDTVPDDIGRTIVIAWNASTETARTVALGMPFLEKADAVIVLSVEDWSVPGPLGDKLVRQLIRHDIPARAATAERRGRQAGEAILDEARSLGADLLFKGAYTQSRLRQFVFGGATRHVLAHSDIPVLLAH